METNRAATLEPPPLRLTGHEEAIAEWGRHLDALGDRYPRRPRDLDDDAAIGRLIALARAQQAAWEGSKR